ncbi:MAG: Hsp20/alpha crystallin family protein [Halobacteriales archaeon]|nr:Hsp20/alpha crystallin family protein [Halobacteriales archaeon]|tara:strand:+ start:90 stop:470 length:381 start_codon:yes stop_codon:yes gene_type:complete
MRDFDDPFEDIFEEIQAMMGSMMGSMGDGGQIQSGSGIQTDIQELEGEMIITVDLQGFEKEEISIKCNGFVLLVNAKNIDLEVDEQIVLPKIGNSELVEAKYRNGILVVTCPKIEEGFETREIEIE